MTPIRILDGGLGTSLEQKYNIKFSPSTPLWSSDLLVSNPDALLQCQSDFGQVPVDILLTATYQISINGFKNTKTPAFPNGIATSEIPQFLEKALTIAEKATQGSNGSVALSLGPYGACMIPSQEYSGNYDEDFDSQESLYEWHRDRLQLFATLNDVSSRICYVSMETIPRVDEIVAMRRALDSVPQLARVPFWMSCLYPGDGTTLPSGESIETALRAMFDSKIADALPFGVGINCTKVWKLTSLLQIYEKVIAEMIQEGLLSGWPALILYPDGTNGEVYNTVTQTWDIPDSAQGVNRTPWEEQLAEIVRGTESRGKWQEIVVGGCCMASSEDISRLRMILATKQ
ncbi:AdoMet-homocysteine methyltransferase [Conoideocrella luteorostrata]|uniref:AdoMet-homocysteine methyltransferase n=1 Tax=Conoideocrella luteorostrata TaxID=1105319 RepID=A0AAJ0CZI8_9HYPO|nr:AdoMet-homocysteine methyltransferase [Conoideocrella luteorostrata]